VNVSGRDAEGVGTHSHKEPGHTRTRAHTGIRITQTNLTTIPTHQRTPRPHDNATTETAADSTAAEPEPTAPRSRSEFRFESYLGVNDMAVKAIFCGVMMEHVLTVHADGVAVHGDGTQICHLRRHRHEFWRQHR